MKETRTGMLIGALLGAGVWVGAYLRYRFLPEH